jgi:hypothetical protein
LEGRLVDFDDAELTFLTSVFAHLNHGQTIWKSDHLFVGVIERRNWRETRDSLNLWQVAEQKMARVQRISVRSSGLIGFSRPLLPMSIEGQETDMPYTASANTSAIVIAQLSPWRIFFSTWLGKP